MGGGCVVVVDEDCGAVRPPASSSGDEAVPGFGAVDVVVGRVGGGGALALGRGAGDHTGPPGGRSS
ncbi:MAG TPA: hypothetical protein VEG38_14175, partial [Acidimicrobiia bacterium]|nr:hypothetical protein [Acidimicrobiia bacterium]